ncbi:hypothetical protein [Rheinheimera sp.]|uniref:hypothetical protein n=1 Tax=Rheinheimera sp. TaxID=1869214 RepID=UPI004048C5AA
MAYTVQRKVSANSPWAGVGYGYSESSAYNEVTKLKAQYPNGFFRIIDEKTKQVVHSS